MAARTTVNDCLRQLAASIGAPPLQLNNAGVCAFTYQDQFEIFIEVPEESNYVYFYAPVVPVPALPPSELADWYADLLKLNAFSERTHGATIALDPHQPRILLCASYPTDALDAVRFYNVITHFVSVLQTLREQLAAHSASHAVSSESPDALAIFQAGV